MPESWALALFLLAAATIFTACGGAATEAVTETVTEESTMVEEVVTEIEAETETVEAE